MTGISLDKVPVDLRKSAETAQVSLRKVGLVDIEADAWLWIDTSTSAERFFRARPGGSTGVIQTTTERVLALSTQIDDDGRIKFGRFDTKAQVLGTVGLDDYSGSVNRFINVKSLYPDTRYAPIIRTVIADAFPGGAPAKRGLFGRAKAATAGSGDRSKPVFVVIVTDGNCFDDEETKQALREAADYPIYFMFIGIGGASFAFLEHLDTMTDRKIDNVGFKPVPDPSPEAVSDEVLYDWMLTGYPKFLADARALGTLAV